MTTAPRTKTKRIELFRRERKGLHHYLYLIDAEFGFITCVSAERVPRTLEGGVLDPWADPSHAGPSRAKLPSLAP